MVRQHTAGPCGHGPRPTLESEARIRTILGFVDAQALQKIQDLLSPICATTYMSTQSLHAQTAKDCLHQFGLHQRTMSRAHLRFAFSKCRIVSFGVAYNAKNFMRTATRNSSSMAGLGQPIIGGNGGTHQLCERGRPCDWRNTRAIHLSLWCLCTFACTTAC
jgi:hypothetical protein